MPIPYIQDGKMYIDDDKGNPLCVCTVPVKVVRIETSKERDAWWYITHIGEPLNREVRSPAKRGGAGIANAVATAGAWVHPKLLTQCFDEMIVQNWTDFIQNIRVIENDDDPESISVYEAFWEWQLNNTQSFGVSYGEGEFGFVLKQDDAKICIVWVSAFAKFFNDFRIKEKQEREAVLRFWKKQGWLGGLKDKKFNVDALGQDRFQTRAWCKEINRPRRAYAISDIGLNI
jgi:hypothetical protein